MRGLGFFPRVAELQKKYAKAGRRIENDLQTNGVLLDEEWAVFLKEHRFLVGLSIDGSRELHDALRVNKGGAPTFDKVMAAASLLRRRADDDRIGFSARLAVTSAAASCAIVCVAASTVEAQVIWRLRASRIRP